MACVVSLEPGFLGLVVDTVVVSRRDTFVDVWAQPNVVAADDVCGVVDVAKIVLNRRAPKVSFFRELIPTKMASLTKRDSLKMGFP